MENSFHPPLIADTSVSLWVWSIDYSMWKELNPIFSPKLCQCLLLAINGNLEKEFKLVGIKNGSYQNGIFILWLKNWRFYYVLGKNENTCITRLTENRNFISMFGVILLTLCPWIWNFLENRSCKVKGELFSNILFKFTCS